MIMRRGLFLAACLLTTAMAPLHAQTPESAALAARPQANPPGDIPRGEVVSLGDNAFAFVPETAEGPLSLLVLLPGTGGTGRELIAGMIPAAYSYGMVLLAPTARGENWDAVDNFFDDYERPASTRGGARYPAPRFGRDVGRVDRALETLFGRIDIDPERVWMFGFSHGGSYALALGLANPELFSRIAVVSPGLLLGSDIRGRPQDYYVAHGRGDPSQRFSISEEIIVPTLEARGHHVIFRPFAGGHTVPPEILQEALRFLVTGSPDEAPAGE